MKNKKVMKNIHVLRTDKSTGIFETNSGLQYSIMNKVRVNPHNGYHIYITNDEEIKEGDWVYCTERKLFGKVIEIQLAKFKSDSSMLYFEINNEEIWCKLFNCKKIILTTDGDLIKDGVQKIDDEFLEWFVKNPSCEEVVVDLIQTEPLKGFIYNFEYKIIIPKEEQKELRRKLFTLIKSLEQEEPKQDPLEQAAKEYAEMHLDVSETLGKYLVKAVFQDSAKWQKEQDKDKYSEEEVVELLEYVRENFYDTGSKWHSEPNTDYTSKELIEQFKKKSL